MGTENQTGGTPSLMRAVKGGLAWLRCGQRGNGWLVVFPGTPIVRHAVGGVGGASVRDGLRENVVESCQVSELPAG